ncbi:MAG: PAS domain-containing protein [Desulfovibrio sp.]|jgi:PAS domain-containing protein|nr:PAS domain-containing protein [Desulfovibrio sp.]
MYSTQAEKSTGEGVPQYLTPGTRTVFIGIGLFLILQNIAIIIFFLHRVAGIEPWLIKLLLGWASVSLLAACWIMLKSSQCTGSSTRGVKEQTSPLGPADKNFTLPSLCAMLEEGLALVRDGKIVFANSSLSYLLGVQEDELVDTRIHSYIHSEDVTLLDLGEHKRNTKNTPQNPYQSREKSKEAGGHDNALVDTPTRSALRMTTSLGDYRWVICSAHNTLWEGKECSLLLFENLGPLKQVQSSLEEHEQQSRIFLECTPLAVAMFDALGQMTVANSAWHSVWSNVACPIPKRFNLLQDSLLPRQDLERAVQAAFGKIDSGVTNMEFTTPWGETRWFNINFHPMLTLTGNLIGVIMIQQDITDSVRSARREHELNAQLSALREETLMSQKRFMSMFDAYPAVVVCIDENEKIRIWNNAAEAYFEMSRQDTLGREITQLGPKMAPYLPLLSELTIAPDKVFESVKEDETTGGRVTESAKVFRTSKNNALTMLRIEINIHTGEPPHE